MTTTRTTTRTAGRAPARSWAAVVPWARVVAVWLTLGSGAPAAGSGPVSPAAGVEPSRVALVAPRSSRLGQQLRRELATSGFVVVPASSGSDQALESLGVQRAVLVDEQGDRVWLLDRRSAAGGFLRRELPIDRRDDLAPRRVCLAVVEHLRAPMPTAPDTPAPTPIATAQATPTPTLSEPVVAPVRARAWSLGAGTAINFDGAIGEPTGHVQLAGETAVGGPLLISVRLHWPLLGAQLHLPDRHVRVWTMGAAGGFRLRLPSLGARLEPTVGVTTGLRFVLADTDWLDPRQSRVAMVPALCGGAFVGLRYRLIELVHATFELGSEWSRPLGGAGLPYEREAASARATRVAVGVAFNY